MRPACVILTQFNLLSLNHNEHHDRVDENIQIDWMLTSMDSEAPYMRNPSQSWINYLNR